MRELTSRRDRLRIRAYTDFVFKWRWLVLVATLGVGVLLATGARYLEFNTDYQYFFLKDNPQLRALAELQETYTQNENILIVLAPESGQVFEAETLSIVGEITRRGWQLPFATRVDSITNFQHSYAAEDDLIVGDLVDLDREHTAEELDEIRAIALAEPLLRRRLISSEAHVTAINVRHALPGQSSDETTQVAQAARDLATDIENRYPGHSVYITGSVMLSHTFFEATVQDISTLVPIMYVVLLITAIVFLRSFWGTLITFLIIALSSSTAAGIAGWLGVPITPPSSSAPIMIMTLAIADSIHLLVTLFQSMQKGMPKKEAMAESLRINLSPVFLTSLTTAIGLLALNLSEVRPFQELGNVATIGVIAALIYTLVLLPSLVAILPIRASRKPDEQRWAPVIRLGEFVIAKRKGLLWFGLAAAVFLCAMVSRNELNDEFIQYYDESFAFRTDTDFTSENLSGIYTMEFSLDSGEEGGVSDPVFLANVDAFAEWLRTQPDVHHVFTVTDTFKRLNKNMHGDDPKWYVLPEERELAAQYLLLYEMSLPYGLDLNDTIDIHKSSTRLVVTCKNVSAVRMRELQSQTEAWLRNNAPESMWTFPASMSLIFTHISARNIKSSLVGALIAVFLIAIILAVAFRSVRFGVLSILPNLTPVLMAFGIWGMIRGQINVGNAIVSTMALGIIVDDGVHFLSKYLRARHEDGLSSEEAVRYAFATVGSALVATSFVLVAGFLVLALSPFGINAGIGLLTAIMMVLALAGDLLFLPPLLMEIDKSPLRQSLLGLPPAVEPSAE